MLIEQAVFTSARTDRGRGYHLVATSPGVRAEDARQLTAWAPAHNSLCGAGGDAQSVNFHPLAGGSICISRSAAAGAEYSGRPGPRVYTQFFLVPPEILSRFANNPLALLRAARLQGALKLYDPVPATLPAFDLPGRTAAVDEGLLVELTERLGARRVAWLMEQAMQADALVLVNVAHPENLVAGLLNCLPVECRAELSFATGLVYSPRRPFRCSVVEADRAEEQRLARQPGVMLVNLANDPPTGFIPTGWAAYLEEAIGLDRLTTVAAELNRDRPGLRLSDLAWLSDQLRARLQAAASAPAASEHFAAPPAPHIVPYSVRPLLGGRLGPTDEASNASDVVRRSHAAHKTIAAPRASELSPEPLQSDRSMSMQSPSTLLGVTSTELLDKLERLDDLVFETINGGQPALEELTLLWPQLIAELPRELWAESREQYLRYAIRLWETSIAGGVRDPQWAVAALDVLAVLFDAAE